MTEPQDKGTPRPLYRRASEALDAAHKACFNHPGRDVLGMSHGPFSGVNVALGIVSGLEHENAVLRTRLRAAVNSHDAMKECVEALKAAQSFVEEYRETRDPGGVLIVASKINAVLAKLEKANG